MVDCVAQPAVLVEVAAHEFDRAVVVGVLHNRGRLVDLAPARRQHRSRERLVLRVRDVLEADLLQQRAQVARVHVREEHRPVRRPAEPGGRPARSRRRTRSARAQSSGWCPGAGGAGRRRRRRGRPSANAARYASSHPGSGRASWVRKQTSSPEVRSAPRLRVRPWPNSLGAISSSSTPAERAISGERSREPESITSTSSGRSRRSASSSCSRCRSPSLTGMTIETVAIIRPARARTGPGPRPGSNESRPYASGGRSV